MSTRCSNPGCPKPSTYIAAKQCSACHKTKYCSAECSKADWPKHKSECMSDKNINTILAEKAAEHAAKPLPRPKREKCTGCGIRWNKERRDVPIDDCPDCGYMACESCVCHNNRGSCYCYDSNFGRPYCRLAPAWYHMGRGKAYVGDRHPEEYIDQNLDAFETVPRQCGNCGEVKRCLREEWLRG